MGQYIDKEGYTQTTLDLGINNGLDNRNLKQEEAEAKAKKKAEIEEKKNKEKNPTRVNAGVQAYKTRRKNVENEIANRGIFKALNYDPRNNSVNESAFDVAIFIIESLLNN